jgi:SAM-dependent methyltransferase
MISRVNRIKSYQKRFEKYGLSPKSLKWRNRNTMEKRFREIVADLDFTDKEILDIGCGFGNIIPFVKRKAKNFSYIGVDFVPEFIKAAEKLYPQYKFLKTDYFIKPLKENFDIIIASGCLNSNVRNNLEFRKKAIKSMFDHAKETLVFNMLGGYPQPKTSPKNDVWFANSLEILKFCLELTPEIIFRSQYLENDFTIIMFKRYFSERVSL